MDDAVSRSRRLSEAALPGARADAPGSGDRWFCRYSNAAFKSLSFSSAFCLRRASVPNLSGCQTFTRSRYASLMACSVAPGASPSTFNHFSDWSCILTRRRRPPQFITAWNPASHVSASRATFFRREQSRAGDHDRGREGRGRTRRDRGPQKLSFLSAAASSP